MRSFSPLIFYEWKADPVSRVAARHHKAILLHHAHVYHPAQ